MKCKTCGFNNELYNMQFCGLNCAEKGYFKQAEQIAELFHLLMQAEPWLYELTSSVDSVSLEELMPLVNDIQALKGQGNE